MPTHYHKPDYSLFITIGVILLFGLVMLSQVSNAIGYQKFQDSYYYIKHQLLLGLLPGLLLFFILAKIDYRRWRQHYWLWFVISVGLLLSVFIPGLGTSYGTSSRSWLNIFGMSIQPSEIVKLTLILYLAGWLSQCREDYVKNWRSGFIPFCFVISIVVGLVVLQQDLGTAVILVSIAGILYFVVGGKIAHLGWLGLIGAGFLALLIKIKPYRVHRITAFFNSDVDPLGIGYHTKQALLAIGSGGFWGRGLGESRQKFSYLPEVLGDSIFAVIAEELGFIVVVILISLFIYLIYRGFKLAEKAPDKFGQLVVTGIICWFGFQAFINIGSMLRLVPMTGLPLPFISYGGTALTISLGAVGVLFNISRQSR